MQWCMGSNIGDINQCPCPSCTIFVPKLAWQMFILSLPNAHFVSTKQKVPLVFSQTFWIGLCSISNSATKMKWKALKTNSYWPSANSEDLWRNRNVLACKAKKENIWSVTFQIFHQLTKLKSATIKRLIGLWKFVHQNDDWICRWRFAPCHQALFSIGICNCRYCICTNTWNTFSDANLISSLEMPKMLFPEVAV